MVKLMDLIVEKLNYNKELSSDERVLLQSFARGRTGKKAGDFESKDINVPLASKHTGDIEKIKKSPVWKSGPSKGLPQTERTGYTSALFYKGKEILRHKEGPFMYPKDFVDRHNAKGDDKYKSVPSYNGGLALVADKPYERKLRIALGFIASKTVKGHWVDETPLRTIKKVGL